MTREDLNPEQKEAVAFDGGSLLVLAGAGTGKTRVLTSRFAWLVERGDAEPDGILAVTFTNKAAAEMKERVAALLGGGVRPPWIGTFHATAHRLLRRHTAEAGLRSGFQIIDKGEQVSVVRRVLKEDRGQAPSKEDVRDLSNFIAGCKEFGQAPADVDADSYRIKKWLPYYERYEQVLGEENKVDFGGLMMRSYALLANNEEIRRRYAEGFRHVLVDEFQDTSRFQYEWLKIFRSGSSRFFAVGDDDQSVYGFRSADPRIMQTFCEEFEVPNIVRLEINYRSQPCILSAANALISRNSNRIGKTLRPHADAGSAQLVRLRMYVSDQEEAQSVTDLLEGQVHSGGALEEAAILYRTNAQSRLFERQLFSRGIPYRIYGGLRFFERKEVKDALAYLRLAVDPQDREALQRVVNFPPRKIGDVTQKRLFDDPGGPWAGVEKESAASRSVAQFRRTVEDLVRAREGGNPLAELVGLAIEKSGLLAHYGRDGEDAERLENLKELVNAAEQFERDQGGGTADAADFVSYASLDSGQAASRDGGGVTLMTVHAAKGLEFGTVFLVGVEDSLFPHKMAADSPDEIEEERRLMYVAVTRAKRELQLSYAHSRMQYGRSEIQRPSRFLDELPDDVLDRPPLPEPKAPHSAPHGRTGRPFRRGSPAAPAAAATRSMPKGGGYKSGDMVSHPKFGKGVVMAIHAGASGLLVEAYFKSSGRKKIDTSVVALKLESK